MMLDLVESRLFGRVCYGYTREKNGLVSVNEEEAKIIKMIFELSINGNSLKKLKEYYLKKFRHHQAIRNGADLGLIRCLPMKNIYYTK